MRAGCVLAALRDLHATFADDPPQALCPLQAPRPVLPATMAPFLDGTNPLPRHAVEAWRRARRRDTDPRPRRRARDPRQLPTTWPPT